jgi:hypothetical protein
VGGAILVVFAIIAAVGNYRDEDRAGSIHDWTGRRGGVHRSRDLRLRV